MKTFLTIIVTVAITWCVASLVHGARVGVERLWLISAVKMPGRMAIDEIQQDMDTGRYDLAKAKLKVFKDTWQRFDRGPDSFNGLGIGDVMVEIGRVSTNNLPNVAHP